MGSSDELPIYESRRTPWGLWQRYLVYRDRIEIRSMFGIYRLRYPDIESITVSPPLGKLIASGKLKGAGEVRGMKADWADLREHVVIRMKRGVIRAFRFTPEDPPEFAYAANSALRQHPKILRQG